MWLPTSLLLSLWLAKYCLLSILANVNAILLSRTFSSFVIRESAAKKNWSRWQHNTLFDKIPRKHDNSCMSSSSSLYSTVQNKLFDYAKEELIGTTIYSGEPTFRAKQIDIRQLITTANIYTVYGDPVSVNDVIGSSTNDATSIVVFLRSLG